MIKTKAHVGNKGSDKESVAKTVLQPRKEGNIGFIMYQYANQYTKAERFTMWRFCKKLHLKIMDIFVKTLSVGDNDYFMLMWLFTCRFPMTGCLVFFTYFGKQE